VIGTIARVRTVDDWKVVLRDALREAMRARDTVAVAALRETLAAIDNAEAADPSAAPRAEAGPIAGAVAGLGAGEVPRRQLGADDVAAIVAREIGERRAAAATFAALGRADDARRLERQADLLAALG
jgi:uncharacterized protein YqeY